MTKEREQTQTKCCQKRKRSDTRRYRSTAGVGGKGQSASCGYAEKEAGMWQDGADMAQRTVL